MMDTQLSEIISYLEAKELECIISEKPNQNMKNLSISVYINGKEMILRVEFLDSFPYSFPLIYLLEEFHKDIAPVPHIMNNGYICTFDSNISIPNHNEPCKLVYESINKATEIIEDGMKGINKEDFIDEFTSYWSMEVNTSYNVFTLFNPDDNPRLLFYTEKYNIFYVCDDLKLLEDWLKYTLNVNISEEQIKKCLYIPLKKLWYPPYPKTDKEIYLKLKEDAYFESYYKFLLNKNSMSLVIFSQEFNDSKYFGGWIHMPVSSPHSFRRGKINPEFTYQIENKDREILKLNVHQFDRERLFNRGGDGNIIDYKVSVSGCGSIGSFLIQALSELGIESFKLIDNDKIASENIARHTCGASDIAKYKTEAIKEKMIKHYPYIKVESIPENIFDVLNERIELYNDCDFNFIVVGYKPLEAKVVELFNENKINKPIILIWVEPFLLGGHAIILQNKQNIFPLLYNDDYSFKHNIVVDGGNYTKKESGCNSTFIPYSSFEAKQFMYSFLDYFHNTNIRNVNHENYLFSWCGDLKWARSEGIKLADNWISKNNREILIKKFQGR